MSFVPTGTVYGTLLNFRGEWATWATKMNVLKRKLEGASISVDQVLEATEYVTPAIEIIDARIEQFDRHAKAMRKVQDTTSDNAANAGIVPGGRKMHPRGLDLPWCGAILRQNGAVEETGLAAGVQGHPAIWAASSSVLCKGHPMQTPVNPFKQAIGEKRPQIGLWLGLADHYTTEICAGAGFDWLLIDGEHSPNDLRSILQQAQVIAAYPHSHAIARVPVGHGNIGTALIKQYLDLGLQTLLVPMVDTPQQAQDLVRASRYPPDGTRGMGGARASRWGRYPNYGKEANAQICLLVQVETREALKNLDAIVATEGVDGVFIGPADLSAALGHIGNPMHAEVQAAIEDAIGRIVRAGKAAGILTPDETLARKYLDLGATFVAVGLDTNLLMKATSLLASRFKTVAAAASGQTS